MKQVLVALSALVLFNPLSMSAQKHHVYADAATPLLVTFPGFSITYDHKFAKHWSGGIGMQGYRLYQTPLSNRKFTPAVYGDIRLLIRPEKNNQFFSFFDLGMDFYRLNDKYYRDSITVYNIPHNNGFYTGLGVGYFRRMTERGWGPYLSLKMSLNWYRLDEYSIISQEQNRELVAASGGFAVSLGFKF